MKTERELFEDAMQELSGGQTKNEINQNTGEYLYGVMEVMWKVWLASAQREGYKLVAVDPAKEHIHKFEEITVNGDDARKYICIYCGFEKSESFE